MCHLSILMNSSNQCHLHQLGRRACCLLFRAEAGILNQGTALSLSLGSALQNLSTNAWTGSVLIVSYGARPPQLSLSHTGHSFSPQPVCLDSFQNYSFWRWQLDLKLLQQESLVEYWVTTEWAQGQIYQKAFRFTLPGSNQCWHWGFHSCNGFSHGRPFFLLFISHFLERVSDSSRQIYQDASMHKPHIFAQMVSQSRLSRP